MIFTHGITDDTGTFTVRLVRSVIQFDHGIQNPALDRFQSISHIRQRPGSNDAHGIADVRLFHSLFQVYFMDLIKNIIFHTFLFLYPVWSNIQILYILCVGFDKFLPWLYFVAHERRKCQINL